MSSRLLPPKSTALERAIEQSLAHLEAPGVGKIWDPWTCQADLLPWLAYAVGVVEWSDAWPEEVRRQSIVSAMAIARRRGTVWAVREALRAAGYQDAHIEEGLPILTHDGSQLYDSVETYGGGARWALFKIVADLGEDKGVGGAELKRLLRLIESAKPVRSVLREVAYSATVSDALNTDDDLGFQALQTVEEVRPAGLRYDGSVQHNQADRLPKQPQHFDGSYRHTGELHYDGLEPNYSWTVHGHRYSNEWDSMTFGLRSSLEDASAINAEYGGIGAHDGAMTYGGSQPASVDTATIALTHRRRYNGRLSHNNQQRYQGSAPDPLTL